MALWGREEMGGGSVLLADHGRWYMIHMEEGILCVWIILLGWLWLLVLVLLIRLASFCHMIDSNDCCDVVNILFPIIMANSILLSCSTANTHIIVTQETVEPVVTCTSLQNKSLVTRTLITIEGVAFSWPQP